MTPTVRAPTRHQSEPIFPRFNTVPIFLRLIQTDVGFITIMFSGYSNGPLQQLHASTITHQHDFFQLFQITIHQRFNHLIILDLTSFEINYSQFLTTSKYSEHVVGIEIEPIEGDGL